MHRISENRMKTLDGPTNNIIERQGRLNQPGNSKIVCKDNETDKSKPILNSSQYACLHAVRDNTIARTSILTMWKLIRRLEIVVYT